MEVGGRIGSVVFAIAVICSCFGAMIATCFTSTRLIAASASQNDLPALFATLDTKRGTPTNALFLHCALTSLFILFGDFARLVTFYGVSSWIFFFGTVLGLLVLRVREPDLARPYKTWIATPIVFCCVALFLVVKAFFEKPVEAGIGLCFILIGIPVYFVRFRPKVSSSSRCNHTDG